MEQLPVDLKRKKLETAVKVGLGIGAAALVAPVVTLAATTVMAASAAVIVGGATAMIVVYRAPVWAHKLALKKIKDIKATAATNPIEEAEQIYITNTGRLEESKKQLEAYIAAYNNFEHKTQGIIKKYPHREAEFQKQLKKHEQLLEHRKTVFSQAKENHAALYDKIQEMKAMWEMAQASMEMDRISGKMNGGDPMEQIRAQAAADAVIKAVNTSMAQLDVALLDSEDNSPEPVVLAKSDVKSITNDPADTLFEMPTKAEQPVHVRRKDNV